MIPHRRASACLAATFRLAIADFRAHRGAPLLRLACSCGRNASTGRIVTTTAASNPSTSSAAHSHAKTSPTSEYKARTLFHSTVSISVVRVKSSVASRMRPSGVIIALIPVFPTLITGVRFSTARITVIASNWSGAELRPYQASFVIFTSTFAPE